MKNVEIVVKATQAGMAMISPYSHQDGLRVYGQMGTPGNRVVRYQVPAYEVWVSGKGPYRAIRFGLRNTGGSPAPRRPCDTGLSHHRICQPTWIASYSPMSFQGRMRHGAWRLLAGQEFLIHEGPSNYQYGGSIGCVEILDMKWGHFLWQIEDIGEADCGRLSAARAVTVILEAASYPVAMLVPP